MQLRFLFLLPWLMYSTAVLAQDEPSSLAEGEALLKANDLAGAQAVAQSMAHQPDVKIRVQGHELWARVKRKEGDTMEADSLWRVAVEEATLAGMDSYVTQLMELWTWVAAQEGDFEKAVLLGEAALARCQSLGNPSLEYRLTNVLSWAYAMTEAPFDKILANYAHQMALLPARKSPGAEAQVYNNVGYDLTVAGRVPLDSTLRLMHQANRHYANQAENHGRWYTLMNLTWQYRLKGQYDSAIHYGSWALEQAQKEEDRHAIIETSFQLGESYLAQGDLEAAEYAYKIGREWRGAETDRDAYVFDVYYANLLAAQGNTVQAMVLLKDAIGFLETSEVFYEMQARATLAGLLYEAGDLASAREMVEKVEQPRRDYVGLESRLMVARVRGQLWAEAGDVARAKSLLRQWELRARTWGAQPYAMKLQALGDSLG